VLKAHEEHGNIYGAAFACPEVERLVRGWWPGVFRCVFDSLSELKVDLLRAGARIANLHANTGRRFSVVAVDAYLFNLNGLRAS
jgi:hypothetical protein